MMGASPEGSLVDHDDAGLGGEGAHEGQHLLLAPAELPPVCFMRVARAGNDSTARSMVAASLPFLDWRMRLSRTVSLGKIPGPRGGCTGPCDTCRRAACR